MKNILFLLVISIFILCSCYTTVAPYEKYTTILDYRKYANNGIFITESNTVPFDYIPLGSISVYVKSGENRGEKQTLDEIDVDCTYIFSEKEKYPIKFFNIYDAIDIMSDSIKKMGGDGVFNFSYNYEFGKIKNQNFVQKKDLSGWTVSGMIFKKK